MDLNLEQLPEQPRIRNEREYQEWRRRTERLARPGIVVRIVRRAARVRLPRPAATRQPEPRRAVKQA